MALIFQMWVESDKNREEIRKYFSSTKEVKIRNKRYEIQVYRSGKTGSMITVDGISQTGIQSNKDAEDMTEIGFRFYELLKDAPDFRYALVGVEVDEWREMKELLEEPNDIKIMKGFVIHEKVYTLIKCSVKLELFKKHYLWFPYEGEIFPVTKPIIY